MKKSTILLTALACLCVPGFLVLYWKPWRRAKYRWTFKPHPTKPDMEELIRKLRGEEAELSFDERLHYWRKLERERHSSRTGTGGGGQSFDERYPRGALADRVQKYLDMEAILRQKYEIIVTKEMLEAELERMDSSPLDRLRLERCKDVLNNDRRLLREILAKPYLVEERIRGRFTADRSVQEERYHRAKARRRGLDAENFREKAGNSYARLRFWLGEGKPPEEGRLTAKALRRGLTPSNFRERAGRYYARLVFWLAAGRAPGPRMLTPSRRMRRIITDVLKKPGDMTGVIEERRSFQILMLASRRNEAATVDAIVVPKLAAEPWLVPNPRMRVVLTELLKEPGDMTGVIEQETSFQILLLTSRHGDAATLDAITVPKVTFDEWFAKERSLLKIQRELKRTRGRL